MTDFNLQVLSPFAFPSPAPHRVVPVRFARAVSGFSDKDAPDVDDHGFTIASNFGPALGPTIGVIKNRTIRVKAIRDRISATADLFATSDDDSIAQIDFPAAGDALSGADVPAATDGSTPERKADCIYIKATSTQGTTAETKIKLRYGAADGAVLAELGVRVYPLLTIQVQAHSVTINGTASTTTHAQVVQLFNAVNKIYAQAGIEFTVRANFPVEVIPGFARAGSVTLTSVADSRNQELQTVLNSNRRRGALNAYFFGHYFDITDTSASPLGTADMVLGIAFSRDDARANRPAAPFPGCSPGVTVSDQGADANMRAHTVAHEIGHSLRLQHYNNGNGTSGALTDMRHDIWAHRCLMHNIVGLVAGTFPATSHYKSSAARTVVGYGSYASATIATGQLLMNKKRPGVFQSEQVNIIQRAALANSFAPL